MQRRSTEAANPDNLPKLTDKERREIHQREKEARRRFKEFGRKGNVQRGRTG